jgi:hypothetical protein
MGLNEFMPEGLEPVQLEQLGRQLSNEVMRLGKIVAQYESEFTHATHKYKLELAKTKILYKDSKLAPTMINALAETCDRVVIAGNELQQAESNLLIGEAELSGREGQYQMVKKIMDLKIQELRVFRG